MNRPRVLIVDDTPENIRVLMAHLKGSCDVLAATSGSKALDFARALPRPDLILLDVMMPGMDGYEVLATLRQEAATAAIPVIFVTGLNDVGDEERGLKLGAVDYITKPFHGELVRARVHNQLELKRHRDYLEEEVARRTEALLVAERVQQRLEGELDVASRLQQSMLPARLFADHRGLGCRLATYLQAARAVGGDLFDYFFVDKQSLFFLLGDVSDKGVPAALFMVRVRTLLRTWGPRTSDPAALLRLMNEELCQENPACMFVTMVCGLLHMDTGSVLLARGGHEHPILVGPGAQARAVEFEGGPALGLCEGVDFVNYSLQMSPGQSLVFYTDGVSEACNSGQAQFGEERLLQALQELADNEAASMVSGLCERLGEFVGGAEPSDDITLLILQGHQNV
ncbi:MAG: fused response regulator/phosphatase [Candidatus Eremiobacteraeota bacterium]|nr:fused response regulator/phosphatase [Candidatus Eremiobacteraeota bacterium]MCW5871349.1 fused response regulator/phosphatase [Candidatus Eremiobacteraeota bacterium]